MAMTVSLSEQSPLPLPAGGKAFELGGWTVHEFETVNSTNLVATGLPVWHAVRAETQTAGRGRFERAWVSDQGGLWLSAVVPASDPRVLAGVPLIAGLAVCNALKQLGVEQLRMRWPNDVLVQDRKLAGSLVDQFAPDRRVIGIGVNVTNQPEAFDPKLRNLTARLADLLSPTPPVREVAQVILAQLRPLVIELSNQGFAALGERINDLWGRSRQVELALDSVVLRGMFNGVDKLGRLLLHNAGSVAAYQPSQVRHLHELT